ncbi:MAG: GNAT family N-acetyltransferase [Sciscionella sp.]|nr:GNAT family N-acetyltransferase [Sciscionella sp.]
MAELLEELLHEQRTRFAAIDPLLPALIQPPVEPPAGEVLTANVPGGGQVIGVLTRTEHPPGTLPSLWSAREVFELHPLVGAAGGDGMRALLARWRQLAGPSELPAGDTACLINWPSRDVTATRALLDHGFTPLSVLAVLHPLRPTETVAVQGVSTRLATERDLEQATELAMAELEYSALVGGAIRRADAESLKRAALSYRLRAGDPVWLAEVDGAAVGLIECRIQLSTVDGTRAWPLPPGSWAYLNCLSVLPRERGRGIGRLLTAVAHRALYAAGARSSHLFYNPPNPISSAFWPRHGYRPLWTTWEVRPASALR